MTRRDYYEILEIDKSANESVIKKSYRKAAMKYHPDVNKEPAAEAKFKEINEAYEVLSDPNKKQIYDRYGHAGLDNQFGGTGGFRGGGFEINLEDLMNGSFRGFGSIFEDFFGGGFGNPNAPKKGRNIQQRIQITLEDAFKGKVIKIKTPKGEKEITIPAGISNGQTLRLHGDGEEGANAGPSGDLHIVIFIQEHEFFKVKGHDLFVTIDVKYIDLLIGKTIETNHLKDKLKFDIPELSNPDKLIRIKGRGMPIINSKQSGDLYIRLNIIMPRKINKKAKKLIEELRKEI